MDTNKQKKENTIIIRLTNELGLQYREYCENNGMSMSKRLRLFIEKDLQGKLTINK